MKRIFRSRTKTGAKKEDDDWYLYLTEIERNLIEQTLKTGRLAKDILSAYCKRTVQQAPYNATAEDIQKLLVNRISSLSRRDLEVLAFEYNCGTYHRDRWNNLMNSNIARPPPSPTSSEKDFEALRIENDQLKEKLDKKNEEIQRLRASELRKAMEADARDMMLHPEKRPQYHEALPISMSSHQQGTVRERSQTVIPRQVARLEDGHSSLTSSELSFMATTQLTLRQMQELKQKRTGDRRALLGKPSEHHEEVAREGFEVAKLHIPTRRNDKTFKQDKERQDAHQEAVYKRRTQEYQPQELQHLPSRPSPQGKLESFPDFEPPQGHEARPSSLTKASTASSSTSQDSPPHSLLVKVVQDKDEDKP